MAYKSLTTLVGQQKIADAIAGTAPLTITAMAVGDGDGEPVTPLETQTELVNEVWRGDVASVARDVAHPNQVVVVATIPLDAGPFMVRELGLYDDDGDLIAVGSHPQIEKTVPAQGTGQTLDLTFILVVDTAAQLTIVLESSPQSDWDEEDTSSPSYIRNKPDLNPNLPPLVPPSRIIEARKGLAGGGDLGADRWFDIDWPELAAASAVNASDILAVYQAMQGVVAADHRKMSLSQLAAWIITQVTLPAYAVESGKGLAGGGLLAPAKTIDINWPELVDAATLFGTDLLALYQPASEGVAADHRKVTLAALASFVRTVINPGDVPVGQNIAVFDTAGAHVWTVPPNVTSCIAEVWGAGGGGGGSSGGGGGDALTGGGGAAGGYARKRVAVVPGMNIPITVGAGGPSHPVATLTRAITGGTSQFGNYCSATGGQGGLHGGSFDYNQSVGLGLGGSIPGVGVAGDLNLAGERGTDAIYTRPIEGDPGSAINFRIHLPGARGGAAPLIGVADVGWRDSTGVTVAPGAGGAGAGTLVDHIPVNFSQGAAGCAGLVIVRW